MNERVRALASLYFEQRLNRMLMEAGHIPPYTYEKTDAGILCEIDTLLQACVNGAGDSYGFIENPQRA